MTHYELQLHNVHHVTVTPVRGRDSLSSSYRTLEVFDYDGNKVFTVTLFSGVTKDDDDELPQVLV